MITIILAEDHQIVRQGLRAMLETEADFSIVAEAGDGLTAIQQVEQWQPEVLILDLMLPGLNGLEVIRQVSRRWPQVRVVILSMYANEAYVLEALRHGAAAYVLKESSMSDLVYALREAMAGQRYLSPPLSEERMGAYLQKAQTTPLDPYETLTGREREVFQLVAEGCTSAEVAARLVISPRTVEMHRANLMRKMNLRSQTELIRVALRRGIVPLHNED